MTTDNQEPYSEAIKAFLTLFRHLRRYSHQVHASGQSGRQLSALRFLLESGESTMGKLSAYLYINESSTTELVDQLEKLGLVNRSRSRSDNRVVIATLTDDGRRAATETAIGGIPLLRERLKTLSRERLLRLKDAFVELCTLLEIPEES